MSGSKLEAFLRTTRSITLHHQWLPTLRFMFIDRFHCHATKKYIGNCPVEEVEKMTCYKRLIYKQFVQVSGLCGPQFLSYLPKRFTHPCRALYGDAILVYRFGPPIWPPEINKTSGVHLHMGSIWYIARYRFQLATNKGSVTRKRFVANDNY